MLVWIRLADSGRENCLSRTKDMTAGSPVKLILGFALPVLAGNMLQQLYSLVD